MSKYSIGIDIGIASVGWSSLLSQTGQIDDLGVRLFSARNSDGNSDRRRERGLRRRLRRRVTRLQDARKYLQSKGFDEADNLKHVSPYELRVKGLQEKLTKSEIFKVIQHILKRRGISYLTDDDDAKDKPEGVDYKDIIKQNKQLLTELTPGQIQLQRLKETGRIKTGYNQNGKYALNVFTVDAYAEELERILRKQQLFHSEIDEDFIQFFIHKGTGKNAGLVYRKRPYYHGPGNEYNPSQYGRWADFPVSGVAKENIFDQLIGTDIRGKTRASTLSLSAQKYNLLNDLNNLRLPREDEKITVNEKEKIINYLLTEEVSRFGPKQIAERLNHGVEEIKGWRVDKNDKPECHSFQSYRVWKKIFAEHGMDLTVLTTEEYDTIAKIVTLNTALDAIQATLEIELPCLSNEIKEVIKSEFKRLRKDHGWHSFSLDTLNCIIPELLNTSDEQNTILERFGWKFDKRDEYSKLNKLPINEVVKEIYNPTVAKSVRQALLVFNALVERYGKENISHVTIEMPREKNEKDQKKIIQDIQKSNQTKKEQSQKYFMGQAQWSPEKFESYITRNSFASKLYYYFEQDGLCAYSGKKIMPDDLLSNATEIDHIIPLSISLDDSQNNKVLVLAGANQEKGQRSPHQAFIEGAQLGRNWSEFEAWVKGNQRYKKHKRKILLETRDIFAPDVQKDFVERNLNDTRYASRIVLNVLQSFFYQSETKIKVVNGAFTHTLRKKWGAALEKDRATHHHHAVDATLCAVTPFVDIDNYEYHVDEQTGEKTMCDVRTGEVIHYTEYKNQIKNTYDKKTYVPRFDNFIAQLYPTTLYPKIKFSHQVDKKYNRKVSDATLYSTREKVEENSRGKKTIKTYCLSKIKDIYTVDGYEKFEKYQDKLLIKEKDEASYNILCDIVMEYPSFKEVQDANGKVKREAVSPFKLYCEENALPGIQKYSRKGNGPIIKSLKYYDKDVNNHINITKDIEGNAIVKTNRGKKVILLQLNPWRTDVYYNSETNRYELLGLKYNHLKFKGENYGVPQEVYNELKKQEGIGEKSEFQFSLYRKDLIEVNMEDEVFHGLFHSKNESGKGVCEIKPIAKDKWDSKEKIAVFGEIASSGQFIKTIKEGMVLRKYNVDCLGNRYLVIKEELKNII